VRVYVFEGSIALPRLLSFPLSLLRPLGAMERQQHVEGQQQHVEGH
jgi:hypothetical protein